MNHACPELIDAEIDSLAEGAFAFLERLVAEPSVVGEEAGAQAVVAAELERLGFAVELLEVPESIGSDPLAGVPQGSYAGRPVVVGRLSGGEGTTLLVNGHVDVVPAGWPELWSSPPFAPARRDGWLHGRGAGDMKCGFAMVLLAVEALRRAAPEALGGSLVFVSAIEEECTGNGTLASIRAGVTGDAVLLPEPTGLDLLLGGAGVLWCDVTVCGRAGHAHEADAGANPILACLALAAALRELEDDLNRGRPAGEARCVVNVGTIEGGDWRSSAPVGARLGVRVGFPPDWAAEAAESAVRAAVASATAAASWPQRLSAAVSFGGFRAVGYALAAEHGLARLLSGAHESVHGGAPRAYRLATTTDARHYLNELALPALCYGPRVRDIHGVDEAVELASIVAGARTLTRFIPAFMT
ncbi:MAG: ArgE/DapE family deacylase [Actinomycetota bacterium]|nr:ArgE/DapE family deacylase [Actinomycetota bacterium]